MKESNETFNRSTEEIGRFHSNIMKPRTIRLAFKLGGDTIEAEFHKIKIEREVEYQNDWQDREKHGPKEALEMLVRQIGHAAIATKDKLDAALRSLDMGTLTHADIREIGTAAGKLIEASWPSDVPLPASFDEMVVYVSMYGGDHLAQRVASGLVTREELLGIYSEIRLIKLEEAAIRAGATMQQTRSVIRAPAAPNRALRRRQEKEQKKGKLEVVPFARPKENSNAGTQQPE